MRNDPVASLRKVLEATAPRFRADSCWVMDLEHRDELAALGELVIERDGSVTLLGHPGTVIEGGGWAHLEPVSRAAKGRQDVSGYIPTADVRCGGLGVTCFDGQATGLFAIQGMLEQVDAEHAQPGHKVQFTVTWHPRGGGGHGPGGRTRTDEMQT